MNNQLKALVIDDEALSADMLEYLIRKNVSSITEVKKATSALEGKEIIKTFKPEILFLDIHMPFMSGFELLELFPKPDFSVIFTTAFDKYAIMAIRFSALDYLLKPVDVTELKQAVDRHIAQRQQILKFQDLYLNFLDNLKSGESKNYRLALQTHNGLRLVPPCDIIRCEGHDNYTHFFITDDTIIVTSKTVKEYESILTGHNFMRVHKSHLVNLDFAEELTPEPRLILKNKSSVEVSSRRKPELAEALKLQHLGSGKSK
ncbi:MAG: LytR/AlgR family response regulator transcription factor [Flavitalea sp.]